MPKAKERDAKSAETSNRAKRDPRKSPLSMSIFRIRLPRRPASYAGAALAAAMAGIVINAAALQSERLPAPFFAPAASRAPASVASATTPTLSTAPEPPARAQQIATPPSNPVRPSDRIAELLRANGGKDSQRIVSSTQAALVKLGYTLRVTGIVNSDTIFALREFEKARKLPISTEITPRLAKTILSAANDSGGL